MGRLNHCPHSTGSPTGREDQSNHYELFGVGAHEIMLALSQLYYEITSFLISQLLGLIAQDNLFPNSFLLDTPNYLSTRRQQIRCLQFGLRCHAGSRGIAFARFSSLERAVPGITRKSRQAMSPCRTSHNRIPQKFNSRLRCVCWFTRMNLRFSQQIENQ